MVPLHCTCAKVASDPDDVSPDGRFVMIERAGGGDVSGDLILVQNFFTELAEKVGR